MSSKLTILDRISSEKNLLEAWKKLNKSNKTYKGLLNISIRDFEVDLQHKIKRISESLKSGKYKFSKVKGVTIPKSSGGLRPLRVPEISDRLVHKALAIEFEKLLSEKFKIKNQCSFAYQKDIGLINAIVMMKVHYDEGYTVILEADIKSFFPSVNVETLCDKIIKSLPDNSVDELFKAALRQELGNTKELQNRKVYEEYFDDIQEGLPQGNALSPLLANICLADFDQRMIADGFKMVRYADDFIIMCKDKDEALKAYKIAEEELTEKLGLSLYELKSKPNEGEKVSKIINPKSDYFSFLSIRFDGKKIWVDSEKIKTLFSKISDISSQEKRKTNGEDIFLLQGLTKLKNLLEGWVSAYYFTELNNHIIEIDKK